MALRFIDSNEFIDLGKNDNLMSSLPFDILLYCILTTINEKLMSLSNLFKKNYFCKTIPIIFYLQSILWIVCF